MAENYTIEWIWVITLFIIGISLLCQGYFIMTGKHGYIHHEREKQKMYNARKQIENLLKNK